MVDAARVAAVVRGGPAPRAHRVLDRRHRLERRVVDREGVREPGGVGRQVGEVRIALGVDAAVGPQQRVRGELVEHEHHHRRPVWRARLPPAVTGGETKSGQRGREQGACAHAQKCKGPQERARRRSVPPPVTSNTSTSCARRAAQPREPSASSARAGRRAGGSVRPDRLDPAVHGHGQIAARSTAARHSGRPRSGSARARSCAARAAARRPPPPCPARRRAARGAARRAPADQFAMGTDAGVQALRRPDPNWRRRCARPPCACAPSSAAPEIRTTELKSRVSRLTVRRRRAAGRKRSARRRGSRAARRARPAIVGVTSRVRA